MEISSNFEFGLAGRCSRTLTFGARFCGKFGRPFWRAGVEIFSVVMVTLGILMFFVDLILGQGTLKPRWILSIRPEIRGSLLFLVPFLFCLRRYAGERPSFSGCVLVWHLCFGKTWHLQVAGRSWYR